MHVLLIFTSPTLHSLILYILPSAKLQLNKIIVFTTMSFNEFQDAHTELMMEKIYIQGGVVQRDPPPPTPLAQKVRSE